MRFAGSAIAVSIRIGMRLVAAQAVGEVIAVLARHHHVDDEKIEGEAAELGARLGGIDRGGDAETLVA